MKRGPQAAPPNGPHHREKPTVRRSRIAAIVSSGRENRKPVSLASAVRVFRVRLDSTTPVTPIKGNTNDGQNIARPPFGDNHIPRKKLSWIFHVGTTQPSL